MAYPEGTLHDFHVLNFDSLNGTFVRGRYVREIEVTGAMRRATNSDEEAHELAIGVCAEAFQRWVNALPAGRYRMFLSVWYEPFATPDAQERDAAWRAAGADAGQWRGRRERPTQDGAVV
eukprot:1249182-Prymnesium_polylepis.1